MFGHDPGRFGLVALLALTGLAPLAGTPLNGPRAMAFDAAGTLYLALRYPDPVIDKDYYRKGIEINQTLANPAASMAPANEGRNHAQTGVPVAPAANPAKP